MLFFLRNNSTHDNMFKYGESLDEDRCRICKEQIKEKENNYYISILITNVNTLNIY